MDEHKSRSGRLRRRAIEFSRMSRSMEDSEDGTVVLQEIAPRVTVEFGPLFRKSDLDSDQFDLEDSDNRIVAEVMAIARTVEGVTLLADDSKPIRLARQAGLQYARPLPEWRRQEGPDEKDIEIANLKREIGAQPILNLAISDLEAGQHLILEDGPKDGDESCTKAFVEAIEDSEPKVTRKSLIKRYGLHSPRPFDIAPLFGMSGLTTSQLAEYDSDYKNFLEKAQQVAAILHTLLSKIGFARFALIDVGNDGDMTADKVLVTAQLSGPFVFLPNNVVSERLEALLEAPTPPAPREEFIYQSINLREHLAHPRVDVFHDLDEPSNDGQCTYVSWRCEELRHGAHFELPVLMAAENSPAKGLLTVEVSGASLAKKTILRVPLVTQSATETANPLYFLQRLMHIPHSYRKAFRTKLESLANAESK